MNTTFEQLKPDQQRVALALLTLEKQKTQWIVGYYTAETKGGVIFQGKGQFSLGSCVLETTDTYEFISKSGTFYRVHKNNSRWIPTPNPAVEKDHLV